MAKAPSKRFANARELAAALCAHTDNDVALGMIDVPRLDALTRDDMLLGAPEPIAEAIAQLDATTDALAALMQRLALVETIAHYVVSSLGRRARVRAGAVDSEHVAALLRELRSIGLDARGWWRLARELIGGSR